jgi:chromosome segregation ATPase
MSPEQCEKSKPHSFVIRSTTRRFVLCADNNTDKETWIRYIERIINQVALKMKMIDTRSSVTTSDAQMRPSNATPLSQTSENKEDKDVDREIEILEKKISDCILHTNSFESRFKDERGKLNAEKENGKIDNQSTKKNKEENEETDEEDEEGDDQDFDSDESESEDSQSDNEEAPAKGRKRQDTLKPLSKRAASLAKMSQDMDKILNMFVQVNSYLLTIEKEKLQTEADIEQLKKHKKLLVREVKNLREKLK